MKGKRIGKESKRKQTAASRRNAMAGDAQSPNKGYATYVANVSAMMALVTGRTTSTSTQRRRNAANLEVMPDKVRIFIFIFSNIYLFLYSPFSTCIFVCLHVWVKHLLNTCLPLEVHPHTFSVHKILLKILLLSAKTEMKITPTSFDIFLLEYNYIYHG